jgi:hypothetical protein
VRLYSLLAIVGAVLVAGGAALLAVPAGVIVLGVEALIGAYGGMYFRAQRTR